MVKGKVVAFDERRGLGTLRADNGIEYPFHATRIADLSRTIPVGATVEFEVVPAQLGRWEATRIVKV